MKNKDILKLVGIITFPIIISGVVIVTDSSINIIKGIKIKRKIKKWKKEVSVLLDGDCYKINR
jgi:hypothetical protein